MSRLDYRSWLGLGMVMAVASLGCGSPGTGTGGAAPPPSTGAPPPPSRTLTVTLSDAMNPTPGDVPCIASMSMSDKMASMPASTTVTWSIDGTGCKNGYDASKLAVKFGKNSKLIMGGNNALKNCAAQSMYLCTITATLADKTIAVDKSRHPYGITLDGEDTGDPEIDIDNGSPVPGPVPAPPTGGGH